MQFYPHRTVEEQASRLPRELRQAYKESQIDRIVIFDGSQELELTGYAEYSYLDEKSYKTQPVRTIKGSIEEIEQYETFLTPRLIIKYNMMGIEDYRSLMRMLKRRNSFGVRCYDVVEDRIVSHAMYVATPSMPMIYQQYLMALGIKEYSIELIGTNVENDITLRINGISYKATYGTIWRDWIDSENNTIGLKVVEDGFLSTNIGGTKLSDPASKKYITEYDFVIAERSYLC